MVSQIEQARGQKPGMGVQRPPTHYLMRRLMMDWNNHTHTEPQPAPQVTNAGACIQDAVIRELAAHGTVLDTALVADVVVRKQQGLDKYGTVLRAFNDRDALVDYYQEQLDALQYAMQGMVEAEGLTADSSFFATLYALALDGARRAKDALLSREGV